MIGLNNEHARKMMRKQDRNGMGRCGCLARLCYKNGGDHEKRM